MSIDINDVSFKINENRWLEIWVGEQEVVSVEPRQKSTFCVLSSFWSSERGNKSAKTIVKYYRDNGIFVFFHIRLVRFRFPVFPVVGSLVLTVLLYSFPSVIVRILSFLSLDFFAFILATLCGL